jgi:hypothetical protein
MDSAPGEVGLTPHGDASLRVSDDDREQAVIALREHLLAGRLTLDEFTERVAGALAAKVGADLAGVRQGLPTLATTVTSCCRMWCGAGGSGCAGGYSPRACSAISTSTCAKLAPTSHGPR